VTCTKSLIIGQTAISALNGIIEGPLLTIYTTANVGTLLTPGNLNVFGMVNFEGGFTETVSSAVFATTYAPNLATGTIHKITASSNFTFNGFTNPIAGQSGTIIITQGTGGSKLMTSTMKFAGGVKTLSTAAGAIDIISVFYDGSVYYASLTKGYA
jgi:hypothetical protein